MTTVDFKAHTRHSYDPCSRCCARQSGWQDWPVDAPRLGVGSAGYGVYPADALLRGGLVLPLPTAGDNGLRTAQAIWRAA
jgi:hypothetical protein